MKEQLREIGGALVVLLCLSLPEVLVFSVVFTYFWSFYWGTK